MTVRIDADLMIPGSGEPIGDATIVLDGGTITYAGPRSHAPATPGAEGTEVPVAMPGLWDCHTHFVGIDKPDI
ncbi:MAG: amidohydrolase family protein, partial [Acidimicrobiia bacterium]